MTTALPELRTDLVAGVSRYHHRRRRRRLTVVATGAVGALVAVLAVALPGGGTEEALAVSRGHGVIELRIADATAGSAQMTEQLRAAGIDGEVDTVPVIPELVGTWVAAHEKPRGAPQATRVPEGLPALREQLRGDEIDRTDDVIRIPVDRVRGETSHYFVFYAGRAAVPGERSIDTRVDPIPTSGQPAPSPSFRQRRDPPATATP